jgi:hypothetical protein
MPKVKVTVDDGRTKRSYTDEYVFLSTFHESLGSPSGRWVQTPEGWQGGLGLFFSAIEALKAVAEDAGSERFKVAARAALDAINKLAPAEGEANEQ